MVALPRFKLTYFSIPGLAETIRLAAAIGKIPFFNKAVEFKDWKDVKPTIPLGQLPILEIEYEDGRKDVISQSGAILRYFGKLGGLYPEDPIAAMHVDSLLDTLTDMAAPVQMSIDGAVKRMIANEPWSSEEFLAIRKRIATNTETGLPFFLSYFERILKVNGTGWLFGGSLTVADLVLFRTITWFGGGYLDGIPKNLMDDYPMIKAHNTRVQELPEVKDWYANHPQPYTDFPFMM